MFFLTSFSSAQLNRTYSTIEYVINLHEHHGLSLASAYRKATSDFVSLRAINEMAQYAAEQEALYYGATWKKSAFVSRLGILVDRLAWPCIVLNGLLCASGTILRAGRKGTRLPLDNSRFAIQHTNVDNPSLPSDVRAHAAQATSMGTTSVI